MNIVTSTPVGTAAFLAVWLSSGLAWAGTPASGDDWLLAVKEPSTSVGEPALSSQAAATQEASPAPSTWPPGLLMEAFDAVGLRKPMDGLGVRVYGWTEAGFTGNLTNGQKVLFGRVFDTFRPNNVQLNQVRLTIDRPYDVAKTFDVGARFDLLYGSDARITKNSFPGSQEYAILEHVGKGRGANWLDFTQAYGQLWFRTGKESGLEATVGKFVTTHGIEVIDATGNALYSHSYLFGYAIPFTHTGAKLNYIWNANWSTYFAIVNGWDDFEDNNHAHSYMAGGAWTSSRQIGGHASDLAFLNVIAGPEQTGNTGNYRTVTDGTYTHWWTEKLSQSINADFGTEQAAAPDGGRANWYGAAHYLTYVFNEHVSGTWRSEWFADDSGARIGAAGNFLENTCGFTLTPWPNHPVLKNLSFRPELRWDHADQRVFSDDHDMMTVAIDAVFKF